MWDFLSTLVQCITFIIVVCILAFAILLSK